MGVHQSRAERRPDRVEREVQLVHLPAVREQEDERVAERAMADDQSRGGRAREHPAPIRAALGVGVREDVDAVAGDVSERRALRIERLGERRRRVPDRLDQDESVAALGVQEPRAQAQVVTKSGETVLEKGLDELGLRPPRLQCVEERVEAAVEEFRSCHEQPSF